MGYATHCHHNSQQPFHSFSINTRLSALISATGSSDDRIHYSNVSSDTSDICVIDLKPSQTHTTDERKQLYMAKSVITEATQLNKTLEIVEASQGVKWNLKRRSGSNLLPGQPLIGLDDGQLLPYLRQALLVPSLDKLSPHLWLVSSQIF